MDVGVSPGSPNLVPGSSSLSDLASSPPQRAMELLLAQNEALAIGLKSAWSVPINGSEGRVLGTFGTYFRTCREPTAAEREIVIGLCRAAALAIERRRADAARMENERKLHVALGAAELGAWTFRYDDHRWELDERAQALYQTGASVVYHDEAVIERIMHPDDI